MGAVLGKTTNINRNCICFLENQWFWCRKPVLLCKFSVKRYGNSRKFGENLTHNQNILCFCFQIWQSRVFMRMTQEQLLCELSEIRLLTPCSMAAKRPRLRILQNYHSALWFQTKSNMERKFTNIFWTHVFRSHMRSCFPSVGWHFVGILQFFRKEKNFFEREK